MAQYLGSAQRTLHAVRPWSSTELEHSKEKEKFPGDNPATIRGCLNCTRERCPGDCAERKKTTRESPHCGKKKGIDPKQVFDLYARGMNLAQIGTELGISANGVKYWLKKQAWEKESY